MFMKSFEIRSHVFFGEAIKKETKMVPYPMVLPESQRGQRSASFFTGTASSFQSEVKPTAIKKTRAGKAKVLGTQRVQQAIFFNRKHSLKRSHIPLGRQWTSYPIFWRLGSPGCFSKCGSDSHSATGEVLCLTSCRFNILKIQFHFALRPFCCLTLGP